MEPTDIIVIGAGLAGLVAAAEAADAGRRVVVTDQEPAASLGGQAWLSFGGLLMIDTPEQHRLGIRDSAELAWDDWQGSAGFDRPEDYWPRRWAKAYVEFAAGEKRSWLKRQGVRLFPVVQWAERGGYQAGGHGNSVPRFHLVWGTGPGLLTPFVGRVQEHVRSGRVQIRFRHRVTNLVTDHGAVVGAAGEVLQASDAARGEPSSRGVAGDFEIRAGAVVVASGGIGGNHDLVRANWPGGYNKPPPRCSPACPTRPTG
jgi:predicted oxidoreductase